MSQQSSSWRFSVLSLDTQLRSRDSAGSNRGFFDRLALVSKEVGATFEFPAAVREECDLFFINCFERLFTGILQFPLSSQNVSPKLVVAFPRAVSGHATSVA